MKRTSKKVRSTVNLTASTLCIQEVAKSAVGHLCGETYLRINSIGIATEDTTVGLGGLSNQTQVSVQLLTEVGSKQGCENGAMIRFNMTFTIEKVGIWVLTSEIRIKVHNISVEDEIRLIRKSPKSPFEGHPSTIHEYRLAMQRLALL